MTGYKYVWYEICTISRDLYFMGLHNLFKWRVNFRRGILNWIYGRRRFEYHLEYFEVEEY